MNHVLLFLLFIVFALSATSLYVIGNLFKKYKFLYFKYIIFLLLNGSILIIFEFIQIYTTINLKDLINYQIFLKIMANLILIPESLFLIIFPVFTLRIIKKNIKKRKQLIFLCFLFAVTYLIIGLVQSLNPIMKPALTVMYILAQIFIILLLWHNINHTYDYIVSLVFIAGQVLYFIRNIYLLIQTVFFNKKPVLKIIMHSETYALFVTYLIPILLFIFLCLFILIYYTKYHKSIATLTKDIFQNLEDTKFFLKYDISKRESDINFYWPVKVIKKSLMISGSACQLLNRIFTAFSRNLK